MKSGVFKVSRLACDVLVESLEPRVLLSVSGTPAQLSPAMIEQAYGLKNITFRTGGKTVSANGAGETIAIVDAFGDPDITSDLQTFDSNFGISNNNASGQFVLTVATPQGPVTTEAGWAGEESLDVEWAHAIAPEANILLVEAPSANSADLYNAVVWAASQTGVAAVSMSWGSTLDYSDETSDDSDFTTPSGHPGVTFVASSGDTGELLYPSSSPNVLAVGGTTLTVDASGNFISESAWSGSGGGHSSDSGTNKPDVAYDGDPDTGFLVYDSVPDGEVSGWEVVGGTSAGSPQWAAIIALVDQGRSLLSLGSLDGPTQAVPEIDSLPSGDFNDVTGGGFTGLGSPVGEKVISALVGGGITSGPPISTVSPLPATQSTPSFTVQWSGSDYFGGSGVASYSIYVSDNGGAFTPWLSNTTLTSATFTGTPGQTYGFYSIATDNIGNVQPTPSGAQATTTVIVPIIGSLAAAPNPVTAGNSITLTANGVTETGGTVTSTSFYEETNGIPGLQTGAGGDTLISTDTTSPYTATFSTTGLAANTYTFYAQAIDSHGSLSTVVSTTDQVQAASGTATTVIVDDKAATLVGSWTSSTSTAGFYGTDYLTDGNTAKGTKTATFTPTLTAAGNYNVYARWTIGTNRATNVPFFVTWNGGTATISENQQINNGAWVLLGTWNFAAGTGGSVQVRTTGTNGYVIADAVEFVPVVGQSGPAIGSLTATPSPVTVGTTITLTANGVTDTGGTVTSISFYEETNGIPGLQTGAGGDTLISTDTTSPYTATFSTTALAANTYTFYAQAIDNHSSLSTVVSTTDQVQPASGTATTVIVDDKAATLVGSWTSSTSTAGFYGTDYLTDGNTAKGTKTATFTPTLTAAGNYNVYARWTIGTNRATNVPFFVTWNGGTATISENQQINNGAWVLLGTWNFAAGTGGSVQVRTTGTNGYVIADAVEFVPAPATSTVTMSVTGPGVTVTGSWSASTYTPGFIGSDYLTDGDTGKGTKSVTFTPTLAAGSYQVYAHWEAGTTRATNVPITINSASGATTVTENQQLNNDTWVLLGTFTFNATGGSVVISNTGTNGYVIADGIQFVPA